MKRQEGREYQFSERYETYYDLYYQTITEKVRVIKEDEKEKAGKESQNCKKKKKEEQPEEAKSQNVIPMNKAPQAEELDEAV